MKILLGLIAFLVLILLGIAFVYLAAEQKSSDEWFVRHDLLRGSAAVHDQLPYTLNFLQQETLAFLLNESKKTRLGHVEKKAPGSISEVILYLFENQPDRTLIPIKEDYSLFSVSGWPKNTYLRVKHPQHMKTLLETTYDP